MLTLEEVQEKAKGHWFSVEFVKKDNTLRKMTCRLGVKKHLKGGTLGYNPKEHNLLIVWDRDKKDYRSINFDTIRKITIEGEIYEENENVSLNQE